MSAFPLPKPPRPDILAAFRAFWAGLRLIFFRLYQSFRVWCVHLETRLRLLGREWIDKRPRLLLVLLTFLWLVPGSLQLPLVDRDEPRFAYATQEMLDSGNRLVPTFNGQWRFDKPPLVYWWMRAHYLVFGYNNLSARAPSIEATVLCVLLIFAFGSRLYGKSVGLWSAFAFLTCLQVFLHGRLCVADMPLMVFLLLAQWAAWELLQKPSWRSAFVFWVSLAAGFTTKWLVPFAVVGVTLAGFFALKRQWPWRVIGNFKPLAGLALLGVLVAAWAIPAWQATGGEFFRVGILEHVFERGASAFNARAYNPFFYLLAGFVSLMPWLAFVPQAFVALRQNFDDRAKFLLAWAAGSYLLFSLAQTQLPHYVLPAFPALLMLTVASTALQKPSGLWTRRFFKFCFVLWSAFLGVALVLVAALPTLSGQAPLKASGLLLLLALLSLVGLGFSFSRRSALGLACCFALVPLFFGGSAALLQERTPAEKVESLLQREGYPPLLIASGFEEPSLVSAAQARWSFEPSYQAAKSAYEHAPSAALVVLADEFTLESLPALLLKRPAKAHRDEQPMLFKNPPAGGRRFHLGGVNLGRFSWVDCDVYINP